MVGTGRTPASRSRRELRRHAEAKLEPSLMGRKLLIPRRIDVSSSKPVFLGRTAAGARSLRGRQIRHEKAGLSGDRQIGTSWHVFPAGARQSDDAAHTAIMIQEPTERPMNAGDKPSQASWWRAPGNTEIPKMQQNRGALRILAQSPQFQDPQLHNSTIPQFQLHLARRKSIITFAARL